MCPDRRETRRRVVKQLGGPTGLSDHVLLCERAQKCTLCHRTHVHGEMPRLRLEWRKEQFGAHLMQAQLERPR